MPGPRPFHSAVEPAPAASVTIGTSCLLPTIVIKVRDEKPAGRSLCHGIEPQHVAIARVKPLEVAFESVVIQRVQASVAALVAPHVAAVTQTGLPRVRTGGTVSHTTVFAQVAIRVSVFSASEERPVERNLLRV
jgi:hypothetical protein